MRNSVQLIGRLSREVDYRQTTAGDYIARVTLGTREVHRTSSGDKVVDVQWHQLVGWGKIAEMMHAMLRKGKSVAVHGRLIHRTYGDGEEKTFRTEIHVHEFMLMN